MLTIYEQARTKFSVQLIRSAIIIAIATAYLTLAEPASQALLRLVPSLKADQGLWLTLSSLGLAIVASLIIWLSFRITRPVKSVSQLTQSLLLDPTSCRLTHYYGGKITTARFRYFRDFKVTGLYSKSLTLDFEFADAQQISFSLPRVKWSRAIEQELTSYRQAHEVLARLQALDDSKYHSASFVAERIYREVRYPGHHWDNSRGDKSRGDKSRGDKSQERPEPISEMTATEPDQVASPDTTETISSAPSDTEHQKPELKLIDRRPLRSRLSEAYHSWRTKTHEPDEALKDETLSSIETSIPETPTDQARPDTPLDPIYGVPQKDLKYLGVKDKSPDHS